jgi:ParB-like chromosome segregation protein Spo0J
MEITNIKLTDLIPYSKNAKKHDRKQIEKVANSIKRFGFIQPLVVDKNNEIIIGHCRYESAKLLDIENVPCVKVENLTEKEIQALRIADNKLNESDWDMSLVIPELKGLDADLLDLTGFQSSDLGLFEPIGFNEQDRLDEKKKVVCPECGYEFSS